MSIDFNTGLYFASGILSLFSLVGVFYVSARGDYLQRNELYNFELDMKALGAGLNAPEAK